MTSISTVSKLGAKWQKFSSGTTPPIEPSSEPYGILLINKPSGMSSASVDSKIKHHLASLLGTSLRKAPKVGHAGTLDPFASGLMIIGVGKATKDLHLLEHANKSYTATITLGIQTDTDDLTGSVVSIANDETLLKITDSEILDAVNKMHGKQLQTPSSYSAKRIDGRRAYDLVRDGEDFTLKPNEIEIFSTKITNIILGPAPEEHGNKTIDVESEWTVSKGTYIRAIARDIGLKLGVGGHLTALCRTAIGEKYTLSDALELEDITKTNSIEAFDALLDKYPNGSCITIGRFDGVHTGHQRLLKECVKASKEIGARSIAIIVDKNSDDEAHRITDLPSRINYIFNTGIDEVLLIPFEEVKNLEYIDFMNILNRDLSLKQIVLTEEAAFGRGLAGNYSKIAEYARMLRIEVRKVSYEQIDGSKVSSTLIRECLLSGEVAKAGKCLGKHYKLSGIVTEGHKRGRELGFPTANLSNPLSMVPGDGVYYGSVTFNKWRHPAMISVGNNPTFGNDSRSVEVHIPSQDSTLNNSKAVWYELYNQKITVSFEQKIRDMQRFDSIEELKNRLEYDAMLTRTAWEIANDKVAVVPTDTVLGICCKYDKLGTDGIAKMIYELKKRSADKPLQVLTFDAAGAHELGIFNDRAIQFAKDEWPGGTTIIVPEMTPDPTTERKSERAGIAKVAENILNFIAMPRFIGLRVPAESVMHDLLNLISPLYATSANISGESEFTDINSAAATLSECAKESGISQPWYFDCEYSAHNKRTTNQASKVVKIDGDTVEVLRN